MTKFLVTYDLVGTSETSDEYKRLIEKIKSYGTWGKVQKSVWLLKSSKSSASVRDDLLKAMDSDDRLLVIQVTGTAAWQNQICDNQWLLDFLNS
jgi:CRISPR associated protein Cas2